jgi:hypothetical protein
MVYGRRPVVHETGAGLFMLASRGNAHSFAEEFAFTFFGDAADTYVCGCLLTFRTLTFGVQFENKRLSEATFHRLPGFENALMLLPFNAVNTAGTNVELRLKWPGTEVPTSITLGKR